MSQFLFDPRPLFSLAVEGLFLRCPVARILGVGRGE
jgi:hypothetical protein